MEKNVLEFLENSQRMYGEKTACADMIMNLLIHSL